MKIKIKTPGHDLDGRLLQVDEVVETDQAVALSMIRNGVAVEIPETKKKEA